MALRKFEFRYNSSMTKIRQSELLFDFNELNQRADKAKRFAAYMRNSERISKRDYQALYNRTFELFAKSEDMVRKLKKVSDF